MADILLAPTPSNKENLLKMGVESNRTFITVQTQIDAAMAIYQSDHFKFKQGNSKSNKDIYFWFWFSLGN